MCIRDSVDTARQLVDMGCESLCIKDMAALLKPQAAYDIVKAIKTACGEAVRVHVHTHATTGVTPVSYTHLDVYKRQCTVGKRSRVRFGVNGRFAHREIDQSIACSSEAFGYDPAPGQLKTCSWHY